MARKRAQIRAAITRDQAASLARLLAAIFEDPDDDRPRLVYGDALLEAGDPRGEYIVQALSDPVAAHALLTKHRKAWQDFGAKGARFDWRRGFIHGVRATPSALANAGALFAQHPIRTLELTKGEPHAPVFAHRLDRVEWLICRDMHDADFPAFVAAPMPNLARLHFGQTLISGDGNAARLASKACPKLRMVNLDNGHVFASDLAALVDGPFLAPVQDLCLTRNFFGDKGLATLVGSPVVANLNRLDVSMSEVTDAGIAALAASPHLRELGLLTIQVFPGKPPTIDTRGATALAKAATTTLRDLHVLDVRGNVTPAARAIICKAYGDRAYGL